MSRIAGGWEGRDTASYLGKEWRRTSGERKFVELHSGALSALASMRYRSGHVSLLSQHARAVMVQSIREKAKIRQAREEGRPREDDVKQERLDWYGQKGL